jgi:hypothetical protein
MLAHNGGNMVRKGLRETSLSRYNEIDAGDELCIPLKSFLAILHVCVHEQSAPAESYRKSLKIQIKSNKHSFSRCIFQRV